SLGANYSNKLYLGMSIGLPSFRYTGTQTFTESGYMKSYYDIYAENPNSDFLDATSDAHEFLEADYQLEYNYDQTSRGTGVSGTIGLIYKPAPMVNIGISASTPTWYWVTDEGTTFFDTWYYDAGANDPFFTYNSDESNDYLEYVIRT